MRPYDIVAFDVDGTLVHDPQGRTVWEVLNERFAGRADLNAERYADYRAGRISYAEWVTLDVGGWKDAGATRADLEEAFAGLRLIDGAREALATLAGRGYRLFVVSGTLDAMLHAVFPDHPFEEIFTNHIAFDGEGLISHWRATPFDMEGKAQALRALAVREGVGLARCAFVGDSDNDVWIARAAGFSIALNPRSSELEQASNAIVHAADLRRILPYFPEG